MKIYCCGCKKYIVARLTDGKEVYPKGSSKSLPFWVCDACGGFVGCHHKTRNRTKPLGCIPTEEIKNARKEIHKIMDPLWRYDGWDRTTLYAEISASVGWEYHTAGIKNIEEARKVYRIVKKLRSESW